MKFEDYDIAPELKKSIAALGFKRPTDIQFKAIQPVLKGEDVLAIAQTGTGKTAAFAIPVLQLLLQSRKRVPRNQVRCLVLLPTRELAIQIAGVFEQLAKYTQLNIVCLFGGVDQGFQIATMAEGADVLVSTPGRMFDLINQGHIHLNTVEILVLDEADRMLDMGFIRDIRDVTALLPRKRQTLFFSATINKDIKKLAYAIVNNNAIRIQISPKDIISKNVIHSVAFIEMDDKRFFLERLANEAPESKILVFVRTKVRAERVMEAMKRVGIEALTMHGDKEQSDRLDVMAQFKSGKVRMLIATDVSARGIDIEGVDYVVNYDLPDVPENYVHRVGRTGRGVRKGFAVSFCSEEEKILLGDIETLIGIPIEVNKIDHEDYDATLTFSEDADDNWQDLIKEAIREEEQQPVKKKKKK